MSRSRHARITRTAISPRFAISSFLNTCLSYGPILPGGMDALNEDAIASALKGRFGRPLRAFDSVDSTNTIALEWAGEGAPEGALVVADHQTAGRGRWGRAWMSEPGAALQFSLVLRPRLGLDRLGVLGLALGLAT